MKSRKGFTLIELLAVIVILGLLMAIAIPSVTKYITESRKKTLTTTVGNYIGSLVNEVNDLSYTFTGQNTIYAVPIECISLERGGTNPFGHWYQANDAYFAYVLVQYDDVNSKYVYGFTFKDSAGYGLYPTTQANINEKGKQIKTGYDLNKPKTGELTSLTSLAKWQESGFEVDSSTYLQVLEATSEDTIGDGTTTCTLCQKGDNYAQVEEDKEERDKKLAKLIKKHNEILTINPTLTTTSEAANEKGLYVSYDTTTGEPTYYFRGAVQNNYVKFAGFVWKIIRINEDGTVRLILNGSVRNTSIIFNRTSSDFSNMYYSNGSNAKFEVEDWYKKIIADKGYDSYVVVGNFCEQAKVKYSSDYTSGNASMILSTSYIPNFKCSLDGNGKGIFNEKVGLINVDELLHAGAYFSQYNSSYYIYIGPYDTISTMSPCGVSSLYASVWYAYANGNLFDLAVAYTSHLRPVINLNADVTATGTGTSSDPYVVITE